VREKEKQAGQPQRDCPYAIPGIKKGVYHMPIRDVRFTILAVRLFGLSPSKIAGLRQRLRVKNFRLFEPEASF
jgi:hypothetical protein